MLSNWHRTQGLRSLAGTIALCFLIPSFGLCQLPRKGSATRTTDSPFLPFGKVISASSGTATASRTEMSPKEVAVSWGSADQISWQYTTDVSTGMPVERSLDGRKVRFVRFPIKIPEVSRKVVDRAPATKSQFWMEARDVQLSLPESAEPKLAGYVTLKSEDLVSGFSGQMWVEIYDIKDQLMRTVEAGCWGVNPNQRRVDHFEFAIPKSEAAAARRLVVYFGNACKNSFAAAMNNLKKAADAIAPLIEAYARSGGNQDQ